MKNWKKGTWLLALLCCFGLLAGGMKVMAAEEVSSEELTMKPGVYIAHMDVAGMTAEEARQTVDHGHILVNGHRVDIPSYQVKAGDVVAIAPKFKDLLPVKEALIATEHMAVPSWLEVDIEKLTGTVLQLPTRDQIDLDIDAQLIVNLYSK